MSNRTKQARSEWYRRHLAEAAGAWFVDEKFTRWLEVGWEEPEYAVRLKVYSPGHRGWVREEDDR